MENETIDAASKSNAGGQEAQPMEIAQTEHDARTEAAPSPVISGPLNTLETGTIRTLDGELASDEMEQDAINYQILLGKIDSLLERLKLDA